MSAQTSFAWCSDCGYIGPDFKTEEYLPYVDEGREMPGGKTYECPKCGLTIGEQAIQEHFSTFESEVQGLREQLKDAVAQARKAYDEAIDQALKTYDEAVIQVRKAREEATKE